ncbi:c-type cytochrome [uncultured Pseudoteredinibacter sp.]|uniref:c-type cytochrome n=1 Tax=uncultured Pseudoteredinibacter sp. TaxID=1641701 RepID=UPI00260FB2C0|nr:c-type cytochrome [uncultured Pseudoteredinibacter sp.]
MKAIYLIIAAWRSRVLSLLLMVLMAGGLLACSESDQPAAEQKAKVNFRQLPEDPQLAALYQRSCIACHGTRAPAIPQTGDIAAWQPRAAKGMDALLDNVINGVGGMPPLGMCMDCEPEQFEALIEFMAAGALTK